MSATRPTPMASFKAAAVYFALVLGTGFVLGTVRVPFLVPRLGERYAELLEMPIMLVVIVLAARYVARRYNLPGSPSVRLLVGFAALAMSVLAELLLAAAIQDASIAQYIANRDPVSGAVYLVVLLLFALMPYILARFRGARATRRIA
ncbi:MAG: hypothetical protein ABI777_05450 [Betaproteobacteria bacterium]